MKEGNRSEFTLLDVGCGTKPKGDVNIDFFRNGFNPQTGDQIHGELMVPQRINNFVIADATHLPFKDGSFSIVFSSHTIEHVPNPFLMLREMCRVAKKKIIVRCPHRRGSGAVMPFHVNYFDEGWFKTYSARLGFESVEFVTSYDYPISSRIGKFLPKKLQTTKIWRVLGHVERAKFMEKAKIPAEIEVWVRKKRNFSNTGKIKFVVVYNDPQIFANCFASSSHVSPEMVTAYNNTSNEPTPRIFNKVVKESMHEDVWFVFCHQDFILKEDLQAHLKGKEVEAVYGPIGIHLAEKGLSGMIIQADGKSIGRKLKEDAPVLVLDEMCLIAHSEVFRQGLLFDERFSFHFYGADFCLQAYSSGFDVMATQLNGQHKSRYLYDDVTSAEYLSSLRLFKEKWKQFLPLRTTTKLIRDE